MLQILSKIKLIGYLGLSETNTSDEMQTQNLMIWLSHVFASLKIDRKKEIFSTFLDMDFAIFVVVLSAWIRMLTLFTVILSRVFNMVMKA